MNSDADNLENKLDLTQFVLSFLKTNGAVLETNQEITDVLLPKKLCDSLNTEEYILVAPDIDTISEDISKKHKVHKIQLEALF